jgi:tetratricopeptide (TPR) repeat protein
MNRLRLDPLTLEPFRWESLRGAAGRSCVALALALSMAVAPLAHAAELSPAQKQEMKQLYERATRAYDVGKYNEAIEDYQKAYEIGGDPPMLYNIAQAYRLNDQPVEAVRFYRRYLQRAPGARNRDDVERKIAELEKTIEDRRKAAAAATPPPAVPPPVVPVAPSQPGPMVGPPAPSATPSAPAPSATAVATVDTEGGPAPSEGGSTKKILGWSFLGAGALCGAGALAAGLIAKGKANDFSNMSQMNATYDPNIDHAGKLADHVAIGLGIAAGALVVTGGILLLTSSGSAPSESTSPESNPAPTPSAMLMPWLGNGLAGAGALVRY